MNDAQDENEALLAVDSSFTPNWVPRVLVVSRLLRHWQWQLPLVAVHASLVFFAWRCLPLAAEAAGLTTGFTDSSWCSVRASLFWIVGGCGSICDFVAMLAYLRSAEGDLPSAWDQSRLSLEAAHHSLAKVPENIVAASIFQVLPVVLWVRHGLAKFAVAAILMVTIFAFLHFGINALTFEFWGVFIQKSQSEFADTLARGELTFSEAVRAFGRVNAQRKAVAKAVKTCVIGFFSFFCLQQAIMLYDFELRSWGGWIFGANFVSNVLVVVFIFEPYIQFNEWPNELAKEVMENTELEHAAWSPTERCNFCAHLAATRVSVNIFEFEMAPTFRTALPAFFFSWWLYMTERGRQLHMFHDFTGFSFDKTCLGNASAPAH